MMDNEYTMSNQTEENNRDPLDFHKQITVVDCHCDTLLDVMNKGRRLCNYSEEGHVDLVRLQQGGVNVQFFAAFIETVYKPFNALTRSLELINTFYRELDMCGGMLVHGYNTRQIRKSLKNDKIVAVLGIEGGEALNGNLAVLHALYRLGVRFLGLTWNQRNQIADGVGEALTGGGLTKFGREVVREMNNLGMLVDLSHISEAGFWDVLAHSRDPVMVSHANCYTLQNHIRNLKDDQIKALAESGGVLGLSFFPEFTGNSIEDFLDHIDFVAALAGTEVIALGSDFDGIEKTPDGLGDARCYPGITVKLLLERGYTEKEVKGIMGGNVLRLIERVLT